MSWQTSVQFAAEAVMEVFVFATASKPTLGPTQPPIQWIPAVKQSGREADHSPLASTGVKNAWSYTSIPPIRLQIMVLS